MKALKSDPNEMTNDNSQSSGAVCPGVLLGRVVDLRMKNFQQLRYLQQLYEDNILDDEEYVEQKRNIIMGAFRTLD